MIDILERDGLSVELLSSLSYKSELGISLKKTCTILIGTFCLMSSLKLMSGIKANRHWLTCL